MSATGRHEKGAASGRDRGGPLRSREVLDFRPDQGIIRLHEQRVVILSAAAMGLLRKELIDTLGLETARRLMLRFGYADGYHDAVSLRDRSQWASPLEGLRAGAVLHTLEGIVRAEIVKRRARRHDRPIRGERALARLVRGRAARPPLRQERRAGLLVAGGLCERLRQRLPRAGDLLPRNRVPGAGRDSSARSSGRMPRAGATHWRRFALDFQGGESRTGSRAPSRRAVHRRLQELDRRERLVAKRERELNLLRERVARHAASKHFIAGSAAMQEVLELAARVAPLDTTVLVYGESGTGKEFIVRMIHDQSPRASGPFVSVNCAALTETLLESELFGHVRGAFTGAVRDKAGLFEVAGNGTLFLDEIGEVAPTVQAKLLRALQEREIRRVGAERDIKVNARVVAATNRDLRAAVAAGTFREDLYFRLGAFVITVPPLRDRREDIPPLVHEFVRRAAARMKKDVKTVSADAMTALMNYRWPGNVRELEHAIERAVILARGTSIRVRELPPEVSQKTRQRVRRRQPRSAGAGTRHDRARARAVSAATGARPPRR